MARWQNSRSYESVEFVNVTRHGGEYRGQDCIHNEACHTEEVPLRILRMQFTEKSTSTVPEIYILCWWVENTFE